MIMTKQETLEEVSKSIYPSWYTDYEEGVKRKEWIKGAKWQGERSYSEENMRKAFIAGFTPKIISSLNDAFDKWFEQFKKK